MNKVHYNYSKTGKFIMVACAVVNNRPGTYTVTTNIKDVTCKRCLQMKRRIPKDV